MAKRMSITQVAPASLKMHLFAPGMTPLHRAGLGGLACTLDYIERAYEQGLLDEDQTPGAPWMASGPPWKITPRHITLHFGQPESAGEFLRRLFAIGFGLREGLISLPGQFQNVPPSIAVLAEVQKGIVNTFLSHVPTSGSRDSVAERTYEVDGKKLTFLHMVFTSYKLQGWYWLVRKGKPTHHKLVFITDDGTLDPSPARVDSALIPGGQVRHAKYTETSLTEPPERLIPLHFAVVGCLEATFRRQVSGAKGKRKAVTVGVLIVPAVRHLREFQQQRPWMSPNSIQECRIASPSDAALQAMVRLRARAAMAATDLPRCVVMTFQPTAWDSRRSPRVQALEVKVGSEHVLDLFEKAMLELPPRLLQRKDAKEGEVPKHFWIESHIRPLIADNLAANRPWYTNFVSLMSSPADARKTTYERKGLHAMIEKTEWDKEGAETVVRAVHEAIRQRFGRIAEENRDNPVAMKKRWGREYERWRIAFAGAKVADQFRHSLADLWSRAGNNTVLREAWQTVLPMLSSERWKLARDLALVGLASYAGREAEEMEITESPEEGEQE